MSIKNKSVLIIGVPRSGTTSLCHAFGKHLQEIEEPLNPIIAKKLSTKEIFKKCTEKNIVFKTIASHVPYDWKGTTIDFNTTLSSYFDYTLLLDRKDTNKQIVSYINLVKYFSKKNKYDYCKGEYTKDIYYQKYLVRELADQLNIKLTYYEDIYSDKLKKVFCDLGIEFDSIDYKYLNPKHKYTHSFTEINLPKSII
jgi:hypothetical protein